MEPNKKALTLQLDSVFYDRVKAMAKDRQVTMSMLTRQVLYDLVSAHEKEKVYIANMKERGEDTSYTKD